MGNQPMVHWIMERGTFLRAASTAVPEMIGEFIISIIPIRRIATIYMNNYFGNLNKN